MLNNEHFEIFRNVCPRNCYNTCTMLSYIRNGKLYKVTGDPKHSYTQGKLCFKGYAYPKYVYSPNRLRFPLRQYPRGSGKWERISWEQALEQISCKILELNDRYGSNLSLAYNNGSGNIGLLNQQATATFFDSLGPHTKPAGNFCLAAGQDAFSYNFGQAVNPDPELMAHSKLILLWGVNPACTAIHQIKFINAARQSGAKLVVIDPLFTSTAAKADLYIQIKPGMDGLLALGIAKILIDDNAYDQTFVQNYTLGFEALNEYLKTPSCSLEQVSTSTGVPQDAIFELVHLLKNNKPCSSWIGFGFQRHNNSGQNIRAINTLMALTGNIGKAGGGAYYLHPGSDAFPIQLLKHTKTAARVIKNRLVNINDFASSLLAFKDPPVRFLWISSRNPLTQDHTLSAWKNLLQELELIVTTDLFMTETAKHSDLVLPAASHFEEYDLHVSYWHYWLALNEKSLPAYYEAKSDLEIARLLAGKLNTLSPGFSDFPLNLSVEDWLANEITPDIQALYGIQRWQDLKNGPRKLRTGTAWSNLIFQTESKRFEIYSNKALEKGLPPLPEFIPPKPAKYPFQVLSPQRTEYIHSQSKWLPREIQNETEIVQINTNDAKAYNLLEGENIILYNENGSIPKKVKITDTVPPGILVVFQGGTNPINSLLTKKFADMGSFQCSFNGIAYYDIYVDLKKRR